MENNPEIQELIQKAQSGNMSQADQARLQELMQEAMAEAGIEEFAGGLGTPPTQGTISAINGSTVTNRPCRRQRPTRQMSKSPTTPT